MVMHGMIRIGIAGPPSIRSRMTKSEKLDLALFPAFRTAERCATIFRWTPDVHRFHIPVRIRASRMEPIPVRRPP
jgi:hypothetical protein